MDAGARKPHARALVAWFAQRGPRPRAADAYDSDLPVGEAVQDPDGTVRFAVRLLDGNVVETVLIYHPQRWTTHTLIAEGDCVAALTTLEAQTRDGARYSNDYLFLFRFAGEQIAEFWEFVDTLYVQEFFESIAQTTEHPDR